MKGTVIGERFVLEGPLGRGGMAEVWLAHDPDLDRPVAIKLHAPHADPARFDREARAAARLSHPNIARIFDYGEFEGRPYLVLEYLPGGTLEDRLHPGKPLDDDETERVTRDVAAGLAHAHEHGVVHRDLKPSNVLFDADGRAKIVDFGIARAAGDTLLTDAGAVLGTAAYISPEQVAGEPVGPAADVYAFGATLFRMLTGELPFPAESALEMAIMHRSEPAPAVNDVRPDAPVGLAALADAALAKDPRMRPANGAGLLAALAEEAATAPLAGQTTSALVEKPRPRRRRVISALALGAVMLVGILTALLAVGASERAPGTRPPAEQPTKTKGEDEQDSPAQHSTTRQATTGAATTADATTADTKTPPPPPSEPTTTAATEPATTEDATTEEATTTATTTP